MITLHRRGDTHEHHPRTPEQPAAHYKRPDWFTRNVMNKLISGLTRLGVSVGDPGCSSTGAGRAASCFHTPVNLLTIEGTQFLVAPRGETQWVRNVRTPAGTSC